MANGTMLMADSDKLTSCLNITGGLLLGLPENDTVVDGPPVHVFNAYIYGGYGGFANALDHYYPDANKSTFFYQLLNGRCFSVLRFSSCNH